MKDEHKQSSNLWVIGFITLAVLIMVLLAFMPEYGWMLLDPAIAGQFGDAVGGLAGPILSLIGIYYVVQTFREQRKTTLEERTSEKIDGFERRYYELLRIHRENVAEMKLGDKAEGRRVFVKILAELKAAIRAADRFISRQQLEVPFCDQLQIAYYCVFFGVGENSSSSLRPALAAAGLAFTDQQFEVLETEMRMETLTRALFQGHQSRLGHYYRHLYQMVSYVHSQALDIEKRNYVKTIRAQLSTYEQALLLVNSLTGIGWDWWTQDYIKTYELVKNLPRGFVESYCELDVESLFPEGSYFEWQQASGRPTILERVKRSQGLNASRSSFPVTEAGGWSDDEF